MKILVQIQRFLIVFKNHFSAYLIVWVHLNLIRKATQNFSFKQFKYVLLVYALYFVLYI